MTAPTARTHRRARPPCEVMRCSLRVATQISSHKSETWRQQRIAGLEIITCRKLYSQSDAALSTGALSRSKSHTSWSSSIAPDPRSAHRSV